MKISDYWILKLLQRLLPESADTKQGRCVYESSLKWWRHRPDGRGYVATWLRMKSRPLFVATSEERFSNQTASSCIDIVCREIWIRSRPCWPLSFPISNLPYICRKLRRLWRLARSPYTCPFVVVDKSLVPLRYSSFCSSYRNKVTHPYLGHMLLEPPVWSGLVRSIFRRVSTVCFGFQSFLYSSNMVQLWLHMISAIWPQLGEIFCRASSSQISVLHGVKLF